MAKNVGLVFVVLAGIVFLAFQNIFLIAGLLWIVLAAAACLSVYIFVKTDSKAYSTKSWVPKKNKTVRSNGSQKDTVIESPLRA